MSLIKKNNNNNPFAYIFLLPKVSAGRLEVKAEFYWLPSDALRAKTDPQKYTKNSSDDIRDNQTPNNALICAKMRQNANYEVFLDA